MASAKSELEEKKVEFETAFASFMAYQKEASEFRSRIEKILSIEEGNKSAVAREEEVTDQVQVSLLDSTQSEDHLQDEANLEKATGKDEHKSKKGLSKWFRGLGFKKDE